MPTARLNYCEFNARTRHNCAAGIKLEMHLCSHCVKYGSLKPLVEYLLCNPRRCGNRCVSVTRSANVPLARGNPLPEKQFHNDRFFFRNSKRRVVRQTRVKKISVNYEDFVGGKIQEQL